jgi:hypothetical protein
VTGDRTDTPKARQYKYFACDRCGKVNTDYETFGVGDPTRATYCLNHIPRWVRLRMWLRDLQVAAGCSGQGRLVMIEPDRTDTPALPDADQLRRDGARIVVRIAEGYEVEDTEITPAEARGYAAELLRLADEADEFAAGQRALCVAEGHDVWGYDAYQPFPDGKVFIECCLRDGCDWREVHEGWRNEYVEREHTTAAGTQRCIGPGCEYCESRVLAAKFAELLTDSKITGSAPNE